MRILEIDCEPVGPLTKPVRFLFSPHCTIFYDDNEAGKTAVVDVLVNLLFRKSSAQSRFQSKRFEDFAGCVKMELNGKEETFEGDVDIEKRLGFPAEFSRIPIVRGSDLAFLWSTNREKKAPLVDACIRYFSSDIEEDLNTAVKKIRTDAGLPSIRNCWNATRSNQLNAPLELYSKKDEYFRELTRRREIEHELQVQRLKLEEITREINDKEHERQQLEDEIQAVRGKTGVELYGIYGGLKQKLNQCGYERFTREDQALWARLDERGQFLKNAVTELQRAINDDDAELENLRDKLKSVSASCSELEHDVQSAKTYLESASSEKNNSLQRITNAEARLSALLEERNSIDKQKGRNTWAYAVMPTLVLVAVLAFFFRLYVLGWVAAATFVGILVWIIASSLSINKGPKDIDERSVIILKGLGLQPAGTLESSWKAFERYRQDKEQRTGKKADDAQQKYQNMHNQLQIKKDEYKQIEFKINRIEDDQIKRREDKKIKAIELEEIQQAIQDLRDKTGKAICEDLVDSLKEKELLEQEITLVEGQLKGILGPEAEWHSRLSFLKPYFDKFPDPRAEGKIKKIKDGVEKRLLELRESEQALQQEREQLLREKEKATRLHIEDIGTLAINILNAEEDLKAAIRKTLAALWAQKVIESAKKSLEDTMLDPLERAGELFARITRRYKSIFYSRQEGSDCVFSVGGDGEEYSEELLSDGTKAQLLLSLRLALLEKFLHGETGFLILDDPLLSSSESRKRRSIEVIIDYLNDGWQVIYLTVDNATVDLFRELGYGLVDIRTISDLFQQQVV